jgi:hypothetical protein
MCVCLACALFGAPDVLRLDEPTNHLDLEAILWLQVRPILQIGVSHSLWVGDCTASLLVQAQTMVLGLCQHKLRPAVCMLHAGVPQPLLPGPDAADGQPRPSIPQRSVPGDSGAERAAAQVGHRAESGLYLLLLHCTTQRRLQRSAPGHSGAAGPAAQVGHRAEF